MTKDQFLITLDASLKGLAFNERKDILQDYEEHFEIGLEEGKSEEEIAKRLGSPSSIGKELLANYHIEKVKNEMTAGNILRAVWAVIGLGFFNLVIVLGPFIALVAVIFSLWSVALSFTFAPVMVLLKLLFQPSAFILFDLFSSIALCGLGLFLGIGMYFVTKALTKWFIRYLKFNASLVRGGLKHD